jgi:hypothetical protein
MLHFGDIGMGNAFTKVPLPVQEKYFVYNMKIQTFFGFSDLACQR